MYLVSHIKARAAAWGVSELAAARLIDAEELTVATVSGSSELWTFYQRLKLAAAPPEVQAAAAARKAARAAKRKAARAAERKAAAAARRGAAAAAEAGRSSDSG